MIMAGRCTEERDSKVGMRSRENIYDDGVEYGRVFVSRTMCLVNHEYLIFEVDS